MRFCILVSESGVFCHIADPVDVSGRARYQEGTTDYAKVMQKDNSVSQLKTAGRILAQVKPYKILFQKPRRQVRLYVMPAWTHERLQKCLAKVLSAPQMTHMCCREVEFSLHDWKVISEVCQQIRVIDNAGGTIFKSDELTSLLRRLPNLEFIRCSVDKRGWNRERNRWEQIEEEFPSVLVEFVTE